MHRLMLLVLAAAFSFPPAGSPNPNPPLPAVQPEAPPSAVRPTVSDRLGEIADALRLLTVSPGVGTGPLGRNCPEARERMRWSEMPCSPDHLPPLPRVPVDNPY